ncbi:MAG TPA: hypothetical protein VFL63_04295 [Rhodanobacteraceae bacterium]|jgi:hypothetical protein|nr:hypothetical protein [Rhodanobacteraceae bacterium]
MFRKVVASALALTGLLIGLGAFGHSFMGRKALDTGLAGMPLSAHTEKLVYLVWYFCGGCMLVLGLLVIWSAWQAGQGENRGLFASTLIGIFYVLTGALALGYMREPFWSVFVILGALAMVLSVTLRFLPARGLRRPATRDSTG